MDVSELAMKLSKYGTVQICKAGEVFTLLMTGKGLSSLPNVVAIQQLVLAWVGKHYKTLECERNDDSFFCIVLSAQAKAQLAIVTCPSCGELALENHNDYIRCTRCMKAYENI